MSAQEKAGFIYVLSNPSMPDVYKVGRSKHGGEHRAKQLSSTTSMPLPFKCEFQIYDTDCIQFEQIVHDRLDDYRVNENREFFKLDLKRIYAVIWRVRDEKIQFEIAESGLIDVDAIYSHQIGEVNESLKHLGYEAIDVHQYRDSMRRVLFNPNFVAACIADDFSELICNNEMGVPNTKLLPEELQDIETYGGMH